MRAVLASVLVTLAAAAAAQEARTVQDCTRLPDPVQVNACIRAVAADRRARPAAAPTARERVGPARTARDPPKGEPAQRRSRIP
ncbi:MAG TPA: hypothetical protein VM434_15625 [Beijerinckiaceae bacterium]|nr:hypothetical protein [Beijerinckiaceae bacterium]